ncbi:hypothetical protein L204_104658 [Cryptococcus depauperatus]|nr:signal recognition particle receptor subunit beta [Cryptococcus depauperatus CBS 7855]
MTGREANTPKELYYVEPEASPLTTMLAHPLLQDPKFVAAAGGLAVLLLFLAFFRREGRNLRRKGPATILLTGPSDGGKTSLFTKLMYNTYPLTHTSIIPSDTTIVLPSPYQDGLSKQIRLVDLPGHPRLIGELKAYVGNATAVVFVVDIQGIIRNAYAVAEQLFSILVALVNVSARLPPSSTAPQLLLLAHKTDLLVRPNPPSTHCPPDIPESASKLSIERLKSILAREMDRLKTTQGVSGGKVEGIDAVAASSSGFFSRLFSSSAASQQDEEDDETLVWGGKGPFRWEDVEGVEIEWAASGLGAYKSEQNERERVEEGNGLDSLKEFLWKI